MFYLNIQLCSLNSTTFLLIIDIFYPLGELISQHLLRCGSFEVDDHVFMSQRLATAELSARE